VGIILTPTKEQKKIIESDLISQCIIACPGSGKTVTAVRRLCDIRRRHENLRGYIALLSYSNVAVESFRKEFMLVTQQVPEGLSSRVLIETVDSFLTAQIMNTHAARTMEAAKQPFLVQGNESWLAEHKIAHQPYPIGIEHLKMSFNQDGALEYYYLDKGRRKILDEKKVQVAIKKLGKEGAYTHELRRYWVWQTLLHQNAILKALSRRYPYILVDEAQDIGSMHEAILLLIHKCGSQISLIGDPNQAIYEFVGADGTFLHKFEKKNGIMSFSLSENRRSIKPIVNVANKLKSSGEESITTREVPEGHKNGIYILTYDSKKPNDVVKRFVSILKEHKLSTNEAAILCRNNKMIDKINGQTIKTGYSATKQLAEAAILRDRDSDLVGSFKKVIDGVLLLLDTNKLLKKNLLEDSSDTNIKVLRRILWHFLRDPETGLPKSTLLAKSEWQPELKKRVKKLLNDIGDNTNQNVKQRWGNNLTAKKLQDNPLWDGALVARQYSGIRIDTVHQAKGETIQSVMYLATNENLEALLSGTSNEEGRIGYVAVTRAQNLLILAVPVKSDSIIDNLKKLGFLIWP